MANEACSLPLKLDFRMLLKMMPPTESWRSEAPITATDFGSKSEVDLILQYHKDYAEGRDHNSYDWPLFGKRSLFRNE